jgi:hypothetical protein
MLFETSHLFFFIFVHVTEKMKNNNSALHRVFLKCSFPKGGAYFGNASLEALLNNVRCASLIVRLGSS